MRRTPSTTSKICAAASPCHKIDTPASNFSAGCRLNTDWRVGGDDFTGTNAFVAALVCSHWWNIGNLAFRRIDKRKLSGSM
jgi:hypothetical protein